jgi:hypothetical protein
MDRSYSSFYAFLLLTVGCFVIISCDKDDSDNAPQSSITVISPNGGEVLSANTEFFIEWESHNVVGDVRILISWDGGDNWPAIVDSSTLNNGEYTWSPTDTASQCRIRIQSVQDPSIYDDSNADFAIPWMFSLEEASAYAGPLHNTNPDSGHFNYDAYMLREYQIAVNPTINESGIVYSGTLEDWKTESWSGEGGRASYLPPPFGWDINTSDIWQYYDMIGRYYTQFGYGWIDTYSHQGAFTGSEGHIWSISGDEPYTLWFDGNSPFFYHYRDLIGH